MRCRGASTVNSTLVRAAPCVATMCAMHATFRAAWLYVGACLVPADNRLPILASMTDNCRAFGLSSTSPRPPGRKRKWPITPSACVKPSRFDPRPRKRLGRSASEYQVDPGRNVKSGSAVGYDSHQSKIKRNIQPSLNSAVGGRRLLEPALVKRLETRSSAFMGHFAKGGQ